MFHFCLNKDLNVIIYVTSLATVDGGGKGANYTG